jgi:hypothetical protein
MSRYFKVYLIDVLWPPRLLKASYIYIRSLKKPPPPFSGGAYLHLPFPAPPLRVDPPRLLKAS